MNYHAYDDTDLYWWKQFEERLCIYNRILGKKKITVIWYVMYPIRELIIQKSKFEILSKCKDCNHICKSS